MLEQVEQAIKQYQATYRREGFPALTVGGLYALFPDEAENVDVAHQWDDSWPNSDEAGVYLIFGANGRLLYIGKASMNHYIGGRLSNHFGRDKLTKGCRVFHQDGWSERPMYIATVAVPHHMKFEASALEEYLIEHLRPSDNLRGIAQNG
jgi:hypothetical protein